MTIQLELAHHEQLSSFEAKSEELNTRAMSEGELVRLNVGGRLLTTTRTTLTSEPDSVLGRMFDPASPLPPARMIDGAFFIDANPAIFEVGVKFFAELSLSSQRWCWISSVTGVFCFLQICPWKPSWPKQGINMFSGRILAPYVTLHDLI